MIPTQIVAQRFIERAQALGLKGKKRDEAALDFFTGAAAGAEIAGDKDLAKHLGILCALVVAVRGFIGVNEIARGPDNEEIVLHRTPGGNELVFHPGRK
jgi:hypothetical protein